MEYCNSDTLYIMEIVKEFLNIVKFALPIFLIVLSSFDIFHIVITSKEDDIKKYRKSVINRLVNCIIVFLIPTIVFLILKIVVPDNTIKNVSECWNQAR